jgi:AraC-like DNA-binding protein
MPQPQTPSSAATDLKLPVRRKTGFLADGAYVFEDELSGGLVTAPVLTCAAWLLELYDLKSGNIFFQVGEQRVRPTSLRFGLLYPPFSLTRLCFRNPRGRVIGIAANQELPDEFRSSSFIFDTQPPSPPESTAHALAILGAGKNYQAVNAFPGASLLACKTKKLIDDNYLAYPSLARIAQRLGVTHSHLSRQFKKDFGMTPSEYLRRLRVADAPLKLARGEEIIDVYQDVGYNDLSRFYKQFRKTTNTSPGACKILLRSGSKDEQK